MVQVIEKVKSAPILSYKLIKNSKVEFTFANIFQLFIMTEVYHMCGFYFFNQTFYYIRACRTAQLILLYYIFYN